jgi:hypothetical protein
MTLGTPGFVGQIHFSVDRFSVGAPPTYAPDVVDEAFFGQAAGDVFVSGNVLSAVRVPLNTLASNQDMNGELPPVPPGIAVIPPIDDLDALHLDTFAVVPLFFSLALGHPYLGASGFFGCGGDLWIPAPGGPAGPAIAFFALGLGFCADDVDALEFDTTTGDIWYSLTPGSPSLVAGSPIIGCGVGCSAADLFIAPGAGGVGFLVAPAAALGLAATDNLNALSLDSCLTPTGFDFDGDGVDDGCDNCFIAANPSQWDADVDGFGNACDADYTGDGIVEGPDFGVFAGAFGSTIGMASYVPAADHNEDGVIGGPDFGVFAIQFSAGTPGPSGLGCAGIPGCTHTP